jgi:hypothetical protein
MSMSMTETMEQQLRRAHTTVDREQMIESGLLWRAADSLRQAQDEIARLTEQRNAAMTAIQRHVGAGNVFVNGEAQLTRDVNGYHITNPHGETHGIRGFDIAFPLFVANAPQSQPAQQPAAPTPPPADTDAGAVAEISFTEGGAFDYHWALANEACDEATNFSDLRTAIQHILIAMHDMQKEERTS